MPNYGPDCKDCGGEDCCCCSTWLEHQADMKADAERDPSEYEFDDEDDFYHRNDDEDDLEDEDEADPGEMDGDHESALASAGLGLDESYRPDELDNLDDYFQDNDCGD